MGKQTNTPIVLEQKEYDSKLNTSIDNLIEKGIPDEDIKFFIEDFKAQYTVKKKVGTEDSQVASAKQTQDGALQSPIREPEVKSTFIAPQTEIKIDLPNQLPDIFKNASKDDIKSRR